MMRRSMWIVGLFVAALCATGCSTRPIQWWFITRDVPAGERTYHLEYDFKAATWRDRGVCDIIVDVVPSPEGDALSWRLNSETCRAGGALESWISMIQIYQNIYDRGIHVTADSLMAGNWPLVRGPWRYGDRLTIYSVFFLNSILHAEVTHVDEHSVTLTFEFYGGAVWHGDGTLRFEQDRAGLKSIDAEWSGIMVSKPFDATFTATRTSAP